MKSINRRFRDFKYPSIQREDYNRLHMGKSNTNRKTSGEESFFEDLKDIFILSAILGVKNNRYEEFSEGVKFSAEFNEYAGIIYSILVNHAEKKNIELKSFLKKENDYQLEKIIEGYACGGFEILKEKLYKNGESPLENIEQLLEENFKEEDYQFEDILLEE